MAKALRNKEHILSLTGIRAIAAYLVFFHHFTPPADIIGERFFGILWEGHVGVSIFFVLSGFLIAYNYADQVSFEKGFLWSYARNRFARIYPIFAITTAVALIYLEDWSPQAWLLNLTLLRGFLGDYYFYHIGQAWSLTVEFCFYLLAPIILLLVGRVPIGVQCLVFYAFGYLLFELGSFFPELQFLSPPRMLVVNTFFGRCFEFYLGIWLFLSFRGKEVRGYLLAPLHGIFTYLGVVSCVGVLYVFSSCYGLAVYSPTCAPLHHYLFPLVSALLIYGLWKERTLLSALLGSRLMVVLGKSSYIFYLIHAAPFQEMFGISEFPIVVRFACMNLISVLGFFLLERPLHRLLRAPKMPKGAAALHQPG